ncbi:uncharacterized protein LOC132713440 [Ruditapes philippinarum]|uniref:uncharacterized protein LOC132713440 n=1 Tax=Ruditapes philippinarum TaxID=129788 RepID=UPI00295BA07C|nr:uncharacterized protein LOC132713440 [Ruditapes philippinarum]
MSTNSKNEDFPVANLAQYQIDVMKSYGDSIALLDSKTRKSYTYRQVIDRIQKLSAGLRELCLRQGDVICALTFNTIEYPIIWYAANLIGATFQTASPLYTDEELERRFKECNTKFLVATPEQAKRISIMIQNIKLRSFSFSKPNILSAIIVIGDNNTSHIQYESLFTSGSVTTATDDNPRTTASILLSSSGTTGLPKFVRLSHINIISNMIHLRDSLQQKPGTCTVLSLPVFHHFGVHTALGAGLFMGLKIVLMERFETETFLSLIQQYRAEFLQIVPTMAARLIKFADRGKYDLSSVKFIMTAAAPLGIGIEQHLMEMFNLNFIGQGYGLTETGFNSGNTKQHYKKGSSGVIPKGVILKIVDMETGRTLSHGARGEIHVGGPQITIGYLNNPEANKTSFDKDGFFKTGDIGYIDNEGYLFIVDRVKELIKYQGMQVAPAFLEDILVKHPAIADAAVIGIPDEDAGELPKAFVVKQPGKDITVKEISNYIHEHVAPHMRLRGGVEFISEVPRNPSGKILRRFLRDGSRKSKL